MSLAISTVYLGGCYFEPIFENKITFLPRFQSMRKVRLCQSVRAAEISPVVLRDARGVSADNWNDKPPMQRAVASDVARIICILSASGHGLFLKKLYRHSQLTKYDTCALAIATTLEQRPVTLNFVHCHLDKRKMLFLSTTSIIFMRTIARQLFCTLFISGLRYCNSLLFCLQDCRI